MSNHLFFALTLGMAAVTFLIRFSFIGAAGKVQMSERVIKTLRFVPVTVLPAIIAIQILNVNSSMEFDLKNPKVIAAIVCTLISFRLGLVWVVVSGVGTLFLLNYFM
ncbi:AzlD domain-containing protein [Pseudescherichia vulneris]|uniref:AzlD domain-containing protein n=1 Tax=Pseudescherichia vulneris TaxID=566 RepID=UPI00227D2987|nr:AzlD domain-containing protein [Pseudescherichia vulneris]WAH51186.1 AzlD domain-containing protein [Pseudescherichia vulneris]